jgi:hypothetical protein
MVEIYSTIKSELNEKEKFFEENLNNKNNNDNNINTNYTNLNESNEISIQKLQKNYENLIRKLESDLRNHLKVNFI